MLMKRNAVVILFLFLWLSGASVATAQGRIRMKHYGAAQGLRSPGVNCLAQDRDGFIWIGTNMGLTRFDGARFHTYVPRFGTHGAFGMQPRCLAADSLNRLWIGTKLGIFVFDIATSSFSHYERRKLPPEGYYDAIATDSNGRYVWTRCRGQVWRIDVLTDSVVAAEATGASLPAWTQVPDKKLMDAIDWRGCHRGARSWLKDREGGVWIGSNYDGLFYLPPRRRTFLTVDAEETDAPAIVRPIAQCNDGTVFVGTENKGLFRMENLDGEPRLLPVDADFEGRPLHTNIQALAAQGDSLWIGTFGEGIYLYNLRLRKVVAHFHLPNNAVVCLLLGRDGSLLAGTMQGLYVCRKGQMEFKPVEGAEDGFIHALAQTSDGTIWVGALDRPLRRLTDDGNHCRAEAGIMEYPCVTALLATDDGRLWIGTDSKGVWLRKTDGDIVPTMLTGTVMESSANTLVADREGRIWVGTFNGLFCYDPQQQTVSRYAQANGLPTNFLSYGSGCLSVADGQLLMGTHQGLAVFNASSFTQPSMPLKPFFTAVTIAGRDTTVTDALRLDYDNANVSIDYAVPVYACASAVWYRYRLKGSSDDWITGIAGQQRIVLTHLAPGDYRLELQASMTPSRWDGPTVGIDITVTSPWWRTPWAYILYIIIVAAIVMLMFRVRMQRKERDDLRRQIARLMENRELMRNMPQLSPYALIKHIVPVQPADDFMERVDAYLEAHVDDKQLGVESLATHLEVSTSTLYRRMKSTMSLSPVEYIRLYRLKKAALMLRRDGMSIRQVSERLCFSSVAYFTNSFSSQFGVTPGEYRQGDVE